MKKAILFLTALMAMNASATEYICLGADEGTQRVNGSPDPSQPLRPFGHVQGQEVRLIENADGSLSLSVKKSADRVLVIVARQGALLYSEGAANISCVPSSPK